jgi:vacuolar-type H+-ATPase subunit F/Vma7
MAFLAQNKAKLFKILIITLDFKKNANFFAENWQKSQKLVIITSIPGDTDGHILPDTRQASFKHRP